DAGGFAYEEHARRGARRRGGETVLGVALELVAPDVEALPREALLERCDDVDGAIVELQVIDTAADHGFAVDDGREVPGVTREGSVLHVEVEDVARQIPGHVLRVELD